MNEIVTIETFWKTQERETELGCGLYELIYEVDENGQSSERWKESLTTAQTPNLEIPLEAESTSVRVTFRWEAMLLDSPIFTLLPILMEMGLLENLILIGRYRCWRN